MDNQQSQISYDIYKHTNKSEKLKDTTFILGNGNIQFGLRVAKIFQKTYNCKVCSDTPSYFASGEVKISPIKENIRQKDIIIIQSIVDTIYDDDKHYSVNDLLMEIFVLIDAVKRGSAKSITVVLPMYPYQRQDRKDNSRTPISARVITTILESLGVSRVICFDLHADQIQGFFGSTPLDNLFTEPYFIKYITTNFKDDLQNTIIVSPDEGGLKRAVRISKKIGLGTAFMYKERKVANQVDKMIIMGDVKDKICIIVDDMIDTAGTACKAADILYENGAKKVIMCACHGIFSKDALIKIYNSKFDKVCITNTVCGYEKLENNIKNILKKYNEIDCNSLMSKIDIIDVSVLASLAIERCLLGYSLSELIDLKVI
jgi:ribose-phosphate pyrophosphokinase